MKTIYILHGWAIDPNNEAKWTEFRESLQTAGYATVFLPLPGLTTQLDEAWNLDDYVKWLEVELSEVSEPVILLGHSFGGQICCRFTAKNPELVSKLLLLDSAGIIDIRWHKRLKRFIFKTIAKLGKYFFTAPPFKKLLYKLARESDYLTANETQKATMRSVLADEVLDDLPTITAETLIIWGENDTATPIHLGKQFSELLPHSRLCIISDARHSPQFTHPEIVVQQIERFLG